MNNINKNIKNINKDINLIAQRYKRNSDNITLLAVTKSQPLVRLELAINAGQKVFGENYAQEGVKKICYFSEKFSEKDLCWHFIGSLQSNKTILVAKYFDWYQTLDSYKLAYRLNYQRPSTLPPLNVLIKVKNDSHKSGIYPFQIISLAKEVLKFPRLRLRGLMSIPPMTTNEQNKFFFYQKINFLFNELKSCYSSIDTLSLGMSNDYRIAIAAGSTLLRIGTAIFGDRT